MSSYFKDIVNCKMSKSFIAHFALLFRVIVQCGNYYPCSWNPCGDHGQCISMYPSPNLKAYSLPMLPHYKVGAGLSTSSNIKDIFFITPPFSKWEDASTFCIENDASLLEVTLSNNFSR